MQVRYLGICALLLMCQFMPATANPIELTWQSPVTRGHVFIRGDKPRLVLEVRNTGEEPVDLGQIQVERFDRFYQKYLSVLEIDSQKVIQPGESVSVPVDLAIERAGVYDITARVGESEANTETTWLRGEQPPESLAAVPFFATCSHEVPEPWDYRMRREFGSRFERERIVWQDAVDHETGEFKRGPLEQDDIVTVVSAFGGQASGSLASTPPFASENRPRNEATQLADYPQLDKYAAWVELAAKHYLGVIKYWEVHNEPNTAGTFLRASAEELADLHKIASLQAKRVSPELKIIGATTVSIDPEYMDRLRDAGAVDYMDVIAFHQYRWDYPPDQGQVADLKRMIEWRDQYAPGRALWDDEWAPWFKQEEHPDRYAELVGRHLVIGKALGIQQSTLYTWDGHWLRIWNGDFPTPAALAYRTTAQQLTNAMPLAEYRGGDQGVFGYLFERDQQITFVGWVTGESQVQLIKDIPVVPGATGFDLMGNPLDLVIENNQTMVKLTRKPVFLTGVSPDFVKGLAKLKPPAHEPPSAMHPSLWFGFKYPDGSEVMSLPRGDEATITLHVHNLGDSPVAGRLEISSPTLEVLTPSESISLNGGMVARVPIRVRASDGVDLGNHFIAVQGEAEGKSFGRARIRVAVGERHTQYLRMATWEAGQATVDQKEIGGTIHLNWINPGGHMDFKFNLADASRSTLSTEIDSVSPAPADGGEYRISASTDREHWNVLLEDRGGFAWRDVDLTPYVGGDVYVRVENSADKGQVRLRAMRLTSQ